MAPPADAGEEVALRESFEVNGLYLLQVAIINDPGRDVPGLDQFTQPVGRERFVLVVVVQLF